ncbi:hypothetical protein GIB67_005699 [Kingdonia uniflora]|uniref:Fe2OG dioxygenase domain-containing protein n=1 Tax=Kingdonia uniflora TaxID=39325 RepID=A0A7J7NIB4_9MAGN|nr:hypothetical protein GIB67_005699 [Kingdonia uniflora]
MQIILSVMSLFMTLNFHVYRFILILSNGKYKSVVHRAVVNDKCTRISIAVTHGPSLEAVVTPALELIDNENHPVEYRGMKYENYLEKQQSNNINCRISMVDVACMYYVLAFNNTKQRVPTIISMASAAPFSLDSDLPPKTGSSNIKHLVQSSTLTSIPSNYVFSTSKSDEQVLLDEHIPSIDLSLLTSPYPDQRFKIVKQLGEACRDWGFFMVINHGVPESLMQGMLDACQSFFDLTEEEKLEFAGKHVLDPIRCGTSFNASEEKVFFWRDFLKVFVHPEFHAPSKPVGFRDISLEYCKRTREVAAELLKGISESLGLEECYINKTLELDSGFQILTVNLYPPCPQPELAMGMPPHSDHGLLTLLIQNEIGGLQLKHKGKWIHVNALPNSFLVNTADHIEILSNGNYKSVVHRAVVNDKCTRISLAVTHGPSLETVVTPASELIDNESPAAYRGMKYKDYLELQQSNNLHDKSCLDRIRV